MNKRNAITLLAATVLGVGAVQAAPIDWVSAVDGAWEDGTNWSGGVPGAEDFVSIDFAGQVGVTTPGNSALELFTRAQLAVAAGGLGVGGTITNDGSLEVTAGGEVTTAILRNSSGASTTVTDPGSRMAISGAIDNSGEITASAGGEITAEGINNAGSLQAHSGGRIAANSLINTFEGDIAVREDGSLLDIVGNLFNSGRLEASYGGHVLTGSIDNAADLQVFAAGRVSADSIINTFEGDIAVREDGSLLDVAGNLFNSGRLEASHAGRILTDSIDNAAEIQVFAAGRLAANSIINTFEGDITLTGLDSRLEITGGVQNSGTLSILHGATAEAYSLDNAGLAEIRFGGRMDLVDMANTADGVVGVFDAGSGLGATGTVSNSGLLEAALQGGITAAVLNNAHVLRASQGGSIAAGALTNTATGLVELRDGASSMSTAGEFLNFGSARFIDTAGGQFAGYRQQAGVTALEHSEIGAGAGFDFEGGTLLGHGRLDGDTRVESAAVVTPGLLASSAGLLEVGGDLWMGGTAVMELGGIAIDLGLGILEYDRITAGGRIDLAGTVAVSLIHGFLPVLGDFFDLFIAPEVHLAGLTEVLPGLGPGLAFASSILALGDGLMAYRLEVVQSVPSVPEPASLGLTLLTLMLLLLGRSFVSTRASLGPRPDPEAAGVAGMHR